MKTSLDPDFMGKALFRWCSRQDKQRLTSFIIAHERRKIKRSLSNLLLNLIMHNCFHAKAFSFSDLALAANDELRRGQLLQAHGTEGVELARTDADLGAETKFEAITETRRSIHHDRGRL